MNKEESTTLSIKMSQKELDMITQSAIRCGEKRSGHARRILLESAQGRIYSGMDVMQALLGIAFDLQQLTYENREVVIREINDRGKCICQILSSK